MKGYQSIIILGTIVIFLVYQIGLSMKLAKKRANARIDAESYADYLVKSFEFYKSFVDDSESFEQTYENRTMFENGLKVNNYMSRTDSNLLDAIEQFSATYIDGKFGNGYYYTHSLNA